MSKHPDLSGLTSISDAEARRVTEGAAEIFIELMANTCHAEAERAHQAHGQRVYQASGGTLGRIAMQELMNDRAVMGFINEFGTEVAEQARGKDLFGD